MEARSEILKFSGVMAMPAAMRFCISPQRLSRSMTTPLPSTLTTFGEKMPEGIRCSAKVPNLLTTVWPALLPPW